MHLVVRIVLQLAMQTRTRKIGIAEVVMEVPLEQRQNETKEKEK